MWECELSWSSTGRWSRAPHSRLHLHSGTMPSCVTVRWECVHGYLAPSRALGPLEWQLPSVELFVCAGLYSEHVKILPFMSIRVPAEKQNQ